MRILSIVVLVSFCLHVDLSLLVARQLLRPQRSPCVSRHLDGEKPRVFHCLRKRDAYLRCTGRRMGGSTAQQDDEVESHPHKIPP